MKIKKKLMAIPACLSLMTTSAHSALILEFNEVGPNVELTFSGSVDIGGAYSFDGGSPTPVIATLAVVGFASTYDEGGSQAFDNFEYFEGSYLGVGNFVTSEIGGDAQIGLFIQESQLILGSLLDANVANTTGNDVTILDAGAGGALFGKQQTFNTSFAASGLDLHASDTLIDLWRVTGTTGTDNLIQFRVNTVPEPSSSLLAGLAGLGFLLRRNRR